MYLTRAQRVALKRIYDREVWEHTAIKYSDYDRRSYLAFRRTVEGLIGGQGCVMVPWLNGGIWLGIETDGHTHS
jgi:hypothetical protein